MPAAHEALRDCSIAQLQELLRLAQLNPGSTWHVNECGCCVCLHPGGDNKSGWIIGEDGDSELRHAHE